MVDDPVQSAKCGHTYCKACITQYLDDVEKTCAACPVAMDHSDVVPAADVKRLLRHLTYKCKMCKEETADPKSHFGTWNDCPRHCQSTRPCKKRSLKLTDYEDHQLHCPNVLYRCEVCKGRVPLKELNQHLADCWTGRSLEMPMTLYLDDEDGAILRYYTDSLSWLMNYEIKTNRLRFQCGLAPADRQQYRRNVHIVIGRLSLELHHPVTNELLFESADPVANGHKLYADCDTDMKDCMWIDVCSLADLKAKSAYDPDRGLTELPCVLKIKIDRIWDRLQRPCKRQSLQQHHGKPAESIAPGASSAVSGPSASSDGPASTPAPGAAMTRETVEVIVAQ